MITADLRGKRALVTGAASGIGLAAGTLLARCGASVAVNDLACNPRLEAAVARLRAEGLEAIAAPGDVGDPEDAGRMVRGAAAAMGGLDFLVNNAATPGTSRTIPPEVRVNAIAPGWVEGSNWECKWTPEEVAQSNNVPLRRPGRPEDYAEVILFLLAGAGYVTGHTVVVDGGLTA